MVPREALNECLLYRTSSKTRPRGRKVRRFCEQGAASQAVDTAEAEPYTYRTLIKLKHRPPMPSRGGQRAMGEWS